MEEELKLHAKKQCETVKTRWDASGLVTFAQIFELLEKNGFYQSGLTLKFPLEMKNIYFISIPEFIVTYDQL